MRTIAVICAKTDHDQRDSLLCTLLGIDGPGAVALREPNGRVMVWATEADSVNDDGARATYRSPLPITDAEWTIIAKLAWIDKTF